MSSKFTILGSGSSMGVPRIDGYFGNCNPKNKKNYRTRCSAIIKFNNINILIEFISSIRSAKAELKITPKLSCDIFFLEKSSKLKTIIKNNLKLITQVGRINRILSSKITDKNTIEILVLNEIKCLNKRIAL